MRPQSIPFKIMILHTVIDVLRKLDSTVYFEIRRVPVLDNCLIEIKNFTPDLIFLSTYFPKLTGLKILRELKDRFLIPIFIISETQTSFERISAINSGADDFIGLPDEDLVVYNKILSKISATR